MDRRGLGHGGDEAREVRRGADAVDSSHVRHIDVLDGGVVVQIVVVFIIAFIVRIYQIGN